MGGEYVDTIATHADAGIEAIEEDAIKGKGRVQHVEEERSSVRREDLVQ